MKISPGSPGPLSHGLRRPYVRVRQGFEDFLDLRERSSSYINAGAACPSQVEGFFFTEAVQFSQQSAGEATSMSKEVKAKTPPRFIPIV